MSTDIEHQLRELFRDKAGDAPVTTPDVVDDAPQRVLRRARRRQVGTVVGSAAIALAIAVGSVAGLNAVLRGAEDRDLVGGSDRSMRTATIEPFTITSPHDWFLVNQWPGSLVTDDPTGGSSATVFQLSNVDLGLDTGDCPPNPLPADAAALTVTFTGGHIIDADPDGPWPADFEDSTLVDGCGPGRIGRFTVSGWVYSAWLGFGDRVDDGDRERLMRAVDSIAVAASWEPPADPAAALPAYVIAGGEYGSGEPWRLDLRPAGDALELTLEGRDGEVWTADESAAPLAWAGTKVVPGTSGLVAPGPGPIFGVVEEGAPGVEFRPGAGNVDFDLGRSPVPGTIVDVPPTLDSFDLDLFFIDPPSGYGELGGRVLVTGSLTPSPSPTVPPAGEPRATEVRLSGGEATGTWIVRFSGSFDGGGACIVVRIVGRAPDDLCLGRDGVENSLVGPNPSLHLWILPSITLLAGSVPPEVRDVRFVADEGDAGIVELQCTIGPIGWSDRHVCAIALSGEGSGTVEYLDAAGTVLFEDGIGWGAAEPLPQPVEPLHGNTYWAVYPWVGAPGDREADDVRAWLRSEFGIEAFPGDLACDEGAAEALGTDAEQGIAVYFETEEDAQAFALRAGLLDHERRVIARVTTYCLD